MWSQGIGDYNAAFAFICMICVLVLSLPLPHFTILLTLCYIVNYKKNTLNHWWRGLSISRIPHINQKTCVVDLCKVIHMIYGSTDIFERKKLTFDFPLVFFTLTFNSNISPNSAALRDILFRNFSDPEFDLSRSLKVKCHGTTKGPIYSFL